MTEWWENWSAWSTAVGERRRDRWHEDKVRALFSRLTSGGTELGWRMSQREEEEFGMTSEGKNEVGAEEE